MTAADGDRAWKRRLSRAILLLGVGAAAAIALPSIPRSQEMVFQLGTDRSDVRRIDASWTRAGEREPFGGVTLRFAGTAPRAVRHSLSVPDGEYVLAIDVERAETSQPPRGTLDPGVAAPDPARLSSTHYVRRIHLQGGETTIALEQDR